MSAQIPTPDMKSEIEAEDNIEGTLLLETLNRQLQQARGWKWGSYTLATIMGFATIGANYAARNLTFADPNTGLTLALEATIFLGIAAGASVAGGMWQWKENQIKGKVDFENQQQSDLDVVEAIKKIENVHD